MSDWFCSGSQLYLKYAELRDLRSTLIANCILRQLYCLIYTTVRLNIVIIYAIHKTSTMERALKTLLQLSLACSDVAVGLFGQALYTFFLVKWLQLDKPGCNTRRMLHILSHFFSAASLFGVVAVSVDGFLAVHYISDTKSLLLKIVLLWW